MARFLLGVNYWPRSSAMAMWSHFDAGEIEEDFARIADLGLDVVRLFLLWDAFQPASDEVAELPLARLELVLDRLHERKLRALPTLFCGHMSGVNWLPPWALDRSVRSRRFRTITGGGESPYGCGDLYAGPLLDAQRLFARRVGERVRDHAALLAWDLGNEFSNLRRPASVADGVHWSAALAQDLFAASNVGVTGGLHGEDLTEDRNIRPSSLCEPWAYASMHGYPVYSTFARGPGDPEVVPFLYELTSSFAGKRVLFTELGNPSCAPGQAATGEVACLSDEAMVVYARAVLDRLQHRGALGAFWWCWADYVAALATQPPFDRAPHELSFGLVRADGELKPVAEELRRFARERRTISEPPPPLVGEARYYAGLPRSTFDAYAAYRDEHSLSEQVS